MTRNFDHTKAVATCELTSPYTSTRPASFAGPLAHPFITSVGLDGMAAGYHFEVYVPLRHAPSGFQEQAANTYIPADGIELRNHLSGIELPVDRVSQLEARISAFLPISRVGNVTTIALHSFISFMA
jgi:hypothetical protein